jgi:hypothetical protein
VRARRSTITAAATALVAAALVLTGCSSSDPAAPAASGTSTGSATPTTSESAATPEATPTEEMPADASPLSGRAGGAGKPTLIVKYDNTPNAQPHSGLKKADVVYVEEVEYGLTRLAAVFATDLPKVVGPVRSARISDLDLFANYGTPAFSYSGAQKKLKPYIAASNLIDVSGDQGPYGYYRDGSRRAPYNFMGQPEKLIARAKTASDAPSIGFEFAKKAPAGGKAVARITATYPASSAQFVWNAQGGGYDVRLNGAPARATEGGTQRATTVVVQYVKQYDSGFGDKFGGRTPKEETIGTGKGWVFRNGKAYKITWTRDDKKSPTVYVGADGQVVPFAPGQIWVVLVNRTEPITMR